MPLTHFGVVLWSGVRACVRVVSVPVLLLLRFGYRPGAVPPVAHLSPHVHVVIDAMAAAAAETFPQGGSSSTGGGRYGFPVQLRPFHDESSTALSEPVVEESGSHSEASSSSSDAFRFVCGAGHPELVFLATLQELEILTGATCIANVTDMKVCLWFCTIYSGLSISSGLEGVGCG